MVDTVGPHDIRDARRRLGQQLAALREAAGHTQHSLAPLTLYGRSTIANAETGHQRPDRTFWQRCDEILHADGILTAGYDRIVTLEREYQRNKSTALMTLPPLAASHPPMPTESGDAVTLEDAVARDAQSAAQFTRLVTASAVEPIAIDQTSADIRRLVRSFISRPLTELFDEIRDLHRSITDAILRNKYPHQLRGRSICS